MREIIILLAGSSARLYKEEWHGEDTRGLQKVFGRGFRTRCSATDESM